MNQYPIPEVTLIRLREVRRNVEISEQATIVAIAELAGAKGRFSYDLNAGTITTDESDGNSEPASTVANPVKRRGKGKRTAESFDINTEGRIVPEDNGSGSPA